MQLENSTFRPLARSLRVGFLILVTAVSACSALPQIGGSTGGASAPSFLQTTRSPEDTVKQFLDAWSRKDYKAMYALVSPQSQGMFALAVFQTTYENVAKAIELDSLQYTVHETKLQGITAAVAYDLSVTSPSFGTITDPGRTMRLVQAPDGWRVAWSSMDIFDGLAGGASVQVEAAAQPRGNIYDRNGNVIVEDGGTVVEIYAQRLAMRNEDNCYAFLASFLRLNQTDFLKSIADAHYNMETIFYVGDTDRDAVTAQAKALDDNCGIRDDNGLIQERTDRRYVGHGAMTHVTGYVGQATDADIKRGYVQGDLVGQLGIEAAYDAELRGKSARVLSITEPGGTVIRTLGNAQATPPQSVTLTIDRDLQLATAQALADAYNYAQPSWGKLSPGAGVAIIDVRNGAILALASYPTYDPGLFSPKTPYPFPGAYIAQLARNPNGAFFNRAFQGQYAPGSTFKIITAAAAANEKVIGPTDNFYCDLEWKDGKKYGDTLPVRLDWRASEPFEEDKFPTGNVTIVGALTSSCDPFFYEMGARLFQRGPSVLSNYAHRMGLGQTYGLDMLGKQAAGTVPATTSVEAAINEAIGQGDVQVSPLQMAAVVSGIANGGTLYKPYVVQRVGVAGQTPTFQATPQVLNDMGLTPQTIALVKQGMCDVTTRTAVNTTNGQPLGTAYFDFDNVYYSICGKTGTAQTEREPNAWFVAFVPADKPQIAIAVLSQNSREGSEVAGPIVRRILDAYLHVPTQNYANFPEWWTEEYHPLSIAAGGTGGG